MPTTRGALLVGIDHYGGQYRPLRGAVADAERLSKVLQQNPSDLTPNFNIDLLVSGRGPEVTADTIGAKIENLLSNRSDVAWFHFSGHGVSKPLGKAVVGSLIAQDGSEFRLSDLSTLLADSQAIQTVVTLDCCHSGAAGIEQLVGPEFAVLPEGSVILSGSQRDEPAYESRQAGLFTSTLISGLEGGAADLLGHVTLASLYSYTDEMFPASGQRPMLRANVSALLQLSKCEPPIDRVVLHQLPRLFESEEAIHPLDPSYEPTEPTAIKENTESFGLLQKANGARLVIPVDEEHMYYAAKNSTGCRLTPLGKRYHRLAKEGHI